MTRRKFLAIVLGLLGVSVLYAFSPQLWSIIMGERGEVRPRDVISNAFSRNGKSLVGVVLGRSSDDIPEMVRLSVDVMGGIEKAGFRGRKVLVKPNLNSYHPDDLTTNPMVVKSVVDLLFEAGASEVIVGDMSNAAYPTRESMRISGIQRAVEEAGASIVCFDDDEWVTVKPDRVEYLKELLVPKTVYEAEKIVSVPVVKTHLSATYSMSLKNFVGITHPSTRQHMHSSGYIEEMIAEINLVAHPSLIVMDGTRSLVYGGLGSPGGGTKVDSNVILASGDRAAIDAVGLALVKSFGLWDRVVSKSVWEQRQVVRALELGLGRGRGEIDIVSESLVEGDGSDELMTKIFQNLE